MTTSPAQKTSTTINLIWAALLASTFIYVIIAFVLSRTGWKPIVDRGLAQTLMGIFVAISLIDVMFVSWLKKKSFTEEIASITPADAQRRFIVGRSILLFALSEAPAIFGLVIFFLSGDLRTLLIFWGISFVSFLVARPPREVLERADRSLP
jgi:hypothetical protein